MSFAESLERGRMGESLIAGYLKGRGCHILPVYEIEESADKGPVFYRADGELLTAPDMFVFNGKKFFWVEAKHKSAFSWYRAGSIWTTGIDCHHFDEYLKIARCTDLPVWLLFLQREGTAKGTPADMKSPTGLFGGEINYLHDNIDHSSARWGRYGMYYWSSGVLRKIASLEEVVS